MARSLGFSFSFSFLSLFFYDRRDLRHVLNILFYRLLGEPRALIRGSLRVLFRRSLKRGYRVHLRVCVRVYVYAIEFATTVHIVVPHSDLTDDRIRANFAYAVARYFRPTHILENGYGEILTDFWNVGGTPGNKKKKRTNIYESHFTLPITSKTCLLTRILCVT